jgi:hypothetical protein
VLPGEEVGLGVMNPGDRLVPQVRNTPFGPRHSFEVLRAA